MTGAATTLLICFAGLNKVLFELHAGNVYVEYRTALNTTKYLCVTKTVNPSHLNGPYAFAMFYFFESECNASLPLNWCAEE